MGCPCVNTCRVPRRPCGLSGHQSPVSEMSACPTFQGSRDGEACGNTEYRLSLKHPLGGSPHIVLCLLSQTPEREALALSQYREGLRLYLLLPQMQPGCYQPQPAQGPPRCPLNSCRHRTLIFHSLPTTLPCSHSSAHFPTSKTLLAFDFLFHSLFLLV